MLQFIREEKGEIREALLKTKELSADTEARLKAALEEFRSRFKPGGSDGKPPAAKKEMAAATA
jgi:F-type H+-transporting ATPase subunit alpha